MRVLIQNDLYDIAGQLKLIDPDYKVFYNTIRKVFEIHNTAQRGNSYCLTVPFDTLDNRTIKLVHKTRSENAEKLMEEIEQHNQKLINDEIQKVTNETSEKIQKALKN